MIKDLDFITDLSEERLIEVKGGGKDDWDDDDWDDDDWDDDDDGWKRNNRIGRKWQKSYRRSDSSIYINSIKRVINSSNKKPGYNYSNIQLFS